jgi:hypothetical protein
MDFGQEVREMDGDIAFVGCRVIMVATIKVA